MIPNLQADMAEIKVFERARELRLGKRQAPDEIEKWGLAEYCNVLQSKF
jgi:hypothetical protein